MFGDIYIGGHFSVAAIFLWLMREKSPQKDFRKLHKAPLVIVLNILLCSFDVNISVVALMSQTRDKSDANQTCCIVCSMSSLWVHCPACTVDTLDVVRTGDHAETISEIHGVTPSITF